MTWLEMRCQACHHHDRDCERAGQRGRDPETAQRDAAGQQQVLRTHVKAAIDRRLYAETDAGRRQWYADRGSARRDSRRTTSMIMIGSAIAQAGLPRDWAGIARPAATARSDFQAALRAWRPDSRRTRDGGALVDQERARG